MAFSYRRALGETGIRTDEVARREAGRPVACPQPSARAGGGSRPRGSGCRRHTRIRSLLPSGLLISAAFSSVLLFRAYDAVTEHLVSLGEKPVSLFGYSAPMLDERSISSGERRDCKMMPNYFFKRPLWLKSEKLVLRYSDQFLYLHI